MLPGAPGTGARGGKKAAAKNFIDPNEFTNKYGASHANEIKEAREAKETKQIKQNKDMAKEETANIKI